MAFYSVHLLHAKDVTLPNIGLTYPKILGVHPFIRMPRQMSLAIIAEVGLKKILTHCRLVKNSNVRHCVVVIPNVYLRTMASVLLTPVLDLSPPEILRLFLLIHRLWIIFLIQIGGRWCG